MICPEFCPITFENKWPKHGTKLIEFTCCFCCSMVVWFCGDTTDYCDPCHNELSGGVKSCPGRGKYTLGVDHPPNDKNLHRDVYVVRKELIILLNNDL